MRTVGQTKTHRRRRRPPSPTQRQPASVISLRRSMSRACAVREPWVTNGLTSRATRGSSQAKSTSTAPPSQGTSKFRTQPPRPAAVSQPPTFCSRPLRWPLRPSRASSSRSRCGLPITALCGSSVTNPHLAHRHEVVGERVVQTPFECDGADEPGQQEQGRRRCGDATCVPGSAGQQRLLADRRHPGSPGRSCARHGHHQSVACRAGHRMPCTTADDVPHNSDPGTARLAARSRCSSVAGLPTNRMTPPTNDRGRRSLDDSRAPT